MMNFPNHFLKRHALALAAVHLLGACGCAENPHTPETEIARVNHVDSNTDDFSPAAQIREWKYIVIHHTATDSGSVESIHQAHLQRTDSAGRPWRGIGYHFLIGNGHGMGDGKVEPTFRWNGQLSGAHAGVGTYNDFGIGICLVGNFEETGPTSAQLDAVTRLIAQLKSEFGIDTSQILKHGDLKATACPGRQFPFERVAATPAAGTQLASDTNRSRFTRVVPERMEGISNVAAIQRSRSSDQSSSVQSPRGGKPDGHRAE